MPIPAITVTGTLQDIFGTALTGAQIVFMLCGYGAQLPRVSGTSLLAKTAPIAVTPNGSGVFSQSLWGNDAITPSGTFYTVALLDEQGNTIQIACYKFTGSGSIDLSAQAPYNPPAPPPPGIGFVSGSGSPEGVITASPGWVYSDFTNGELYVKHTGAGNTGWKIITHA